MALIFPITEASMVEKMLPQKQPFVFVDKVLAGDKSYLKTAFTIKEGKLFVAENKLQAAGILEHQAQSVALHKFATSDENSGKPQMGYIASISRFEVLDLPETGDILTTEIRITNEVAGISSVEAVSMVGERIISKSELKTVLA